LHKILTPKLNQTKLLFPDVSAWNQFYTNNFV